MNWFFLNGAPATYESTGVAFLAFWLFQFAFADTCSTITSGAMIGRTGFVGDLIYSFCRVRLHLSDHRPLGLGAGRLPGHHGQRRQFPAVAWHGFHDFAGSTVVHTIGGMVALAGAIVLGPRLGRRFKRDGGGPMLPHDLTIAACGGLLLWFGWYGFNPGSTLSAMDFEGIGRVAANTTLAACAAGLAAMAVAYGMSKNWDISFTVNGFLAGLVAITCPCYWVSPARRHPARRSGRRGRRGGRRNCSNTCASTIPSAPFPSTGSAASGVRSPSVCSPAASMARPDPLPPITRRL